MSGINCQLIACILVVLICLKTEWTIILQGQDAPRFVHVDSR